MPVPEQIMVLLALSDGLFDTIPIDKMQEAENALINISKDLPAEIQKRMFSDTKLSDSDNDSISKMTNDILVPFQEKPEPDQNKQ